MRNDDECIWRKSNHAVFTENFRDHLCSFFRRWTYLVCVKPFLKGTPTMKLIGYRTLKTAIGTALSIGVAQGLELTFYASAGVLTLLCIKQTRKRSYKSAQDRFFACLIGLFFSCVLFETLGYMPWVVALVLLLVIPVNLFLRTNEGIVTSTVIILHIYSLRMTSISIIGNELALIIIGIGFALFVNLYMPNVELELKGYRQEVEENFRRIFRELANYLRYHNLDWDGGEVLKTVATLEKAKELALRNFENQREGGDIRYLRYFEMRERQFDILERMMLHISSIKGHYRQGLVISDFLLRIGEAVHPGNTATIYLEELERIRRDFRGSPLPKTREEFETRAALIHLRGEMKRYLQIKRDLLVEINQAPNTSERKMRAHIEK